MGWNNSRITNSVPGIVCLLWGTFAFADPAAEQQVRCAETKFSQAVEARDSAAFQRLIDPDARFIGVSVERGPEAIAAAWAPYFTKGGPTNKWRPQFVEVLAGGELALTRGPYRVRVKNRSGELVTLWGTFTSVWRRNPEGEWRVVFDSGGAPNEAPAEAIQAILDEPVDCPA